jgi:hypothetical protein
LAKRGGKRELPLPIQSAMLLGTKILNSLKEI